MPEQCKVYRVGRTDCSPGLALEGVALRLDRDDNATPRGKNLPEPGDFEPRRCAGARRPRN
jgi:hypothetical protein